MAYTVTVGVGTVGKFINLEQLASMGKETIKDIRSSLGLFRMLQAKFKF